MSSGMTVEQRWAQFHRYGPYTLLGIAVLMAALSSGIIGMSRGRRT